MYDIAVGCAAMLPILPWSDCRVQRVQTFAARVMSGTRKFDHISDVIVDLKWLPISALVNLIIQYRILHRFIPTRRYLQAYSRGSELYRLYRLASLMIPTPKRPSHKQPAKWRHTKCLHCARRQQDWRDRQRRTKHGHHTGPAEKGGDCGKLRRVGRRSSTFSRRRYRLGYCGSIYAIRRARTPQRLDCWNRV